MLTWLLYDNSYETEIKGEKTFIPESLLFFPLPGEASLPSTR